MEIKRSSHGNCDPVECVARDSSFRPSGFLREAEAGLHRASHPRLSKYCMSLVLSVAVRTGYGEVDDYRVLGPLGLILVCEDCIDFPSFEGVYFSILCHY